MVEIKLLSRVKYKETLYVANDVISVDEATAEYLQARNLCKVMAIVEPVKPAEITAEVAENTAEITAEKPAKKSKRTKQESK